MKRTAWLIAGLLIVVLVSATAFATSSNWQKSGKLLTARTMTLRELFTTLGKPVSALPPQALNAQVHMGPVHKYVIQMKVQKSTQNKSFSSAEQVVQVIFTTRAWIAIWSYTVPTYVGFGAVVEAHTEYGTPVKLMYMSVSVKLTGPSGTIIDSAHGSGLLTDEVDASGGKWVVDAGSYCSWGSFYYFDFTANPPTGGYYIEGPCDYLSGPKIEDKSGYTAGTSCPNFCR